eukprot:g11416.t1
MVGPIHFQQHPCSASEIVNIAWALDCLGWTDQGEAFCRILQQFLKVCSGSLGVEWITLASLAEEAQIGAIALGGVAALGAVETVMARRSCLGSAIVVLLLSCSLSFVPGPARWPAWAAASACLAPAAAWAQEKQDWITMMMKDATEEEDPRKINLGEYQGDAPYYVFATVGSIFFAVTVWQSWQDTFGGGLGETRG